MTSIEIIRLILCLNQIIPELFMHIRNCICKWLCIIRHQYH